MQTGIDAMAANMAGFVPLLLKHTDAVVVDRRGVKTPIVMEFLTSLSNGIRSIRYDNKIVDCSHMLLLNIRIVRRGTSMSCCDALI